MKRAILTFFGLIICLNIAIAQQPILETEKIAITAKIWGFLKYYHPSVAAGKFNWDEELINLLPAVKIATTKEDLSKVYIEWIEGLGQVKHCKKCRSENNYDYFEKNFNLSWIRSAKLLTSELSKKLIFIEQNRLQGKKYYVYADKNNGGAKISNETVYKDFNWTNENLRLLTLFRYWNIIEYFFPYKYQTDIEWNEVLNQMIPKFSNPKTELDFHLAMLELIVSIDDSHAGLYTEQISQFFGKYWIPTSFEIIDDKAIISGFYNESLAMKDDLKIGDIITTVDNQPIKDLFNEKKKYISGANIPMKLYNAFNAIFNGSTDSISIEFIRDNQTYTKSISRYLYEDLNISRKVNTESFKILEDNIGYVNMGLLSLKDVSIVMEALKETKAIIFDIRNYPRGTLYSIANYITSERRYFYKMIYPDLNYPGKFIWRYGATIGNKGELKYKGKVALLVNEKSQSHAEFTIMCLQKSDNVITIGSQTSGADGNVSIVEMAGGEKTRITGIGIFYPDETETQRKGIKIDVVVKRTIQGIQEGKDEVLQKARELVKM